MTSGNLLGVSLAAFAGEQNSGRELEQLGCIEPGDFVLCADFVVEVAQPVLTVDESFSTHVDFERRLVLRFDDDARHG